MIKQHSAILLFLFLSFSVPAKTKNADADMIFDDHLVSKILSGKKNNIKYAAHEWVNYLLQTKKSQSFYPSILKTKDELKQFYQLLRIAKKQQSGQILTDLSDVYLFSAIITFGNASKYFNTLSNPYPSLDRFLKHLAQNQTLNIIAREWYISLIFSSLAGFDSYENRDIHVSSIKAFQVVYEIFESWIHLINSEAPYKFVQNTSQDFFLKFRRDFLHFNSYYKIILPSFTHLSWVKSDVKLNHPPALFEYGQILYNAYGQRGISYISRSADQNYPPAVKFMGLHYLAGGFPNEGEKMITQYMKTRIGIMERIRMAELLFYFNMDKGHNMLDSLQRGAASLKKSCQSIFMTKLTKPPK